MGTTFLWWPDPDDIPSPTMMVLTARGVYHPDDTVTHPCFGGETGIRRAGVQVEAISTTEPLPLDAGNMPKVAGSVIKQISFVILVFNKRVMKYFDLWNDIISSL